MVASKGARWCRLGWWCRVVYGGGGEPWCCSVAVYGGGVWLVVV